MLQYLTFNHRFSGPFRCIPMKNGANGSTALACADDETVLDLHIRDERCILGDESF